MALSGEFMLIGGAIGSGYYDFGRCKFRNGQMYLPGGPMTFTKFHKVPFDRVQSIKAVNAERALRLAQDPYWSGTDITTLFTRMGLIRYRQEKLSSESCFYYKLKDGSERVFGRYTAAEFIGDKLRDDLDMIDFSEANGEDKGVCFLLKLKDGLRFIGATDSKKQYEVLFIEANHKRLLSEVEVSPFKDFLNVIKFLFIIFFVVPSTIVCLIALFSYLFGS